MSEANIPSTKSYPHSEAVSPQKAKLFEPPLLQEHMFFKKKKRMIDVRELQKRGIVRIPKKDIVVPTNREGFVEFGSKNRPATSDKRPANSELFGFMDTSHSNSQQLTANSSSRLTDLDNKIYKLEQRIELLEKKLNINKPTESNLGPMGW